MQTEGYEIVIHDIAIKDAVYDIVNVCITDCYRYVNPTTRLYTWHNIRSFARLDRIYVSTFLKSHIECITRTSCPVSYHDSVNAVFCLLSESRQKSYWKLNVSILENVEYIHLVHQFWEFWSEKNRFSRFIDLVGHWKM